MPNPESAGLSWRKSSWSSNTSDCVEIAFPDDTAMAVRDSKSPTPGAVVVSSGGWLGLLHELC